MNDIIKDKGGIITRPQPRILLAAGASGSGKTLITCGLLQALVNRNLKVSSFKCGPDFIDPMFHSRIIGTKSRNLDTFFTSETRTRYLLGTNAADTDIAVMEGVMGFYDGVAGTTTRASAYDLASVTDTPVILIVNSRGMSISLAAYIKGFLEYRADSNIRGVIFNQMSPMLYPRMKELVEAELPVRVLGYVPKVEDCVIESRHLGLVLPEEVKDLKERLMKLSAILENSLDMEGILKLAGSAPDITYPENLISEDETFGFKLDKPVKIGVSMDEAFCFIYEDNLRLLREMGGEIIPFSPIHDTELPRGIQGMIFYGGYPELFGEALESNKKMREAIYSALQKNMPCMAECGGFMYLQEEMEDMEGKSHSMVGAIGGRTYPTPKLNRFGYITLRQNIKDDPGEDILGDIPAHEFHYFESEQCGSAFHASKPLSKRGWDCIHYENNMMAGYPHLYYYANPRVAKAFLSSCRQYRSQD